MANSPTQGVFKPNYLNACNSPTSTGAQDSVTGAAIPTGLNPYKVIELSFTEAQASQAPSPSIEQLFEGDYMWVQVDSGATQTEIATGRPAFFKLSPASNSVNPILTVTGPTGKTAQSLFAGVFLNPISVVNSAGLPNGNWGFIFNGGGRVNVLYGATLTIGGGAAIGDVIETTATGTFDDTSASTVTNFSVGIALVKPIINGTSQVYMKQRFPRCCGGL